MTNDALSVIRPPSFVVCRPRIRYAVVRSSTKVAEGAVALLSHHEHGAIEPDDHLVGDVVE